MQMENRPRVRSSKRLEESSRAEADDKRDGQAGPPGQGAAEAAAAAAAARAVRRQRALERSLEVEDEPHVLRDKCRQLADALRDARHVVVYTGAGISTAAAIPDYRGPRGVWTRLRRGERVGRVELSRAAPTFTHMALAALHARGLVRFVVSQNCDGLHLRSGLPRRALAEVHGNMYIEVCPRCAAAPEYLRVFDTTERTARFCHATRRLCHRCGAELADSIVHFGERGRARWPLNWAGALRHAERADLILCLGSSLKVLRRYPWLWCMDRAAARRPKLYIVNLQWTPKDNVAELKINARCDRVLAAVARRLGVKVPVYSARRDPLLAPAHHTPLASAEAHTARRPRLRPHTPPPQPQPFDSDTSDDAHAYDDEDERPLCELAAAARLAPPPTPPPDLHSFQVRLHSGVATILLRAQHTPVTEGAEARGREPLLDTGRPPPAAEAAARNGLIHHRLNGLGAHRKVRVLNGKGENGKVEALDTRLRELIVKDSEDDECDRLMRRCRLVARAIIQHAVLVCRANLYSGLHTIIAPPAQAPPPPPPALPCSPPPTRKRPRDHPCDWCADVYGARDCLWYRAHGAIGEGRAHRVVRGRRYLCACCGPGDDGLADAGTSAPAAAGEAGASADEGGWYGKGYRKGRPRRRKR